MNPEQWWRTRKEQEAGVAEHWDKFHAYLEKCGRQDYERHEKGDDLGEILRERIDDYKAWQKNERKEMRERDFGPDGSQGRPHLWKDREKLRDQEEEKMKAIFQLYHDTIAEKACERSAIKQDAEYPLADSLGSLFDTQPTPTAQSQEIKPLCDSLDELYGAQAAVSVSSVEPEQIPTDADIQRQTTIEPKL